MTIQNSDLDDFELWGPSEERQERCLFGRRVSAPLNTEKFPANDLLDILPLTQTRGQVRCGNQQKEKATCADFG